jgi:hypothetical protein
MSLQFGSGPSRVSTCGFWLSKEEICVFVDPFLTSEEGINLKGTGETMDATLVGSSSILCLRMGYSCVYTGLELTVRATDIFISFFAHLDPPEERLGTAHLNDLLSASSPFQYCRLTLSMVVGMRIFGIIWGQVGLGH